jgi:hypothetical protein
MAISKQDRAFPFFRTRSLVLGGIFIASSVAVVGFSQSGMATGGVPESCGLDGEHTKSRSHYSRTKFTAMTVGLTQEKNGLFWNPLSKSWLTAEQMKLLQLAYEIGFEDGGHQHAELLQAILMQETVAGQLGRMGHMTAPVGKRSYGVMQVKVAAARDVLGRYSDLGRFRADEELIAALLSDDEFNIHIASKFLLQLGSRVRTTERSLVAYNIGLTASRAIPDPLSFKYVVSTKTNLEEVVRPFNYRFGGDTLRVATANQSPAGS